MTDSEMIDIIAATLNGSAFGPIIEGGSIHFGFINRLAGTQTFLAIGQRRIRLRQQQTATGQILASVQLNGVTQVTSNDRQMVVFRTERGVQLALNSDGTFEMGEQ